MRKVVVANYADEAAADEAVTDLKAAGITSTAIRRYAGDHAPGPAVTRAEQARVGSDVAGARTVVAVTIEDADSRRVMDILASRNPAELRDTGDAPGAAVGENEASPTDSA